MIEEMQELGLAGHTAREAYGTLRARHDKVPTLNVFCQVKLSKNRTRI